MPICPPNSSDGGGSAALNQEQIIYVGKAGSDGNTGVNIDEPKLTIGGAISAALLFSPADNNVVVIEIIDAGEYASGTVTIPSFVELYAPKATLEGTYLLEDNATMSVFRMRNADSTTLIGKVVGTGAASAEVEFMLVGAGEIGMASTSGELVGDARVITVDAGTGFTTLSDSGNTIIDIDEMLLLNNAVGLSVAADNSTITLSANKVTDDLTSTAVNCTVNGATLNFSANEVIVASLFNIAGLSTLNYAVTNAQGATAAIAGSTIRGSNPTGNSVFQGNVTVGDSLFIETTTRPMNVYKEVAINSHTGINNGGVLSVASATTVDITAGEGHVDDSDMNPTDPTLTEVNWSAINGYTPLNIATEDITYLAIDSSGSLIEQNTAYTQAQRRSVLTIGAVVHVGGTITGVGSAPVPLAQSVLLADDILDGTGTITKTGLEITPNAGGNLSIDFSSGQLVGSGINYKNSLSSPNELDVAGQTAFSFQYVWRDGLGGFNVSAPTTNVEPTQWDNDSGTLQPVGGNDYSIQRVWYSPIIDQWFITYGQTTYPNVSQARQNFFVDPFGGYDSEIITNLVLRAAIIVREDATDLTDNTGANATYFTQAGKLGEFTGGAGGGGTTDLQGAYNNSSIDPRITLDSGIGAMSWGMGNIADVNIGLDLRNQADSTVFNVTGEGVITSASELLNFSDKQIDVTGGASENNFALTYDDVTKKIQLEAVVSSFNSRVGAVVPQSGDYTASQVTNAFDKSADTSDDVTEGSTNLFNKLPAGGSSNQILEKIDGTDYNAQWVDKPKQAFDIPFSAGYGSDGTNADLVVQGYANLIVSRNVDISGEVGYIETPSTGSDVEVDVLKNGVSIYSTKPKFSATSNTLTAGVLSTTTIAVGDRLEFSVTGIGSTVAGSGLTFTLTGDIS